LLGVDTTGETDAVKCQRFAGVVDNGILLRMVSAWQQQGSTMKPLQLQCYTRITLLWFFFPFRTSVFL
jgi:hypothetical protein